MRGEVNQSFPVLASAARTASLDTPDFANDQYRGLIVVIDATASAATPSVVFTIQGKDQTSGKYYDILSSVAITGTGTTVLKVYPSMAVVANQSVSAPLSRIWRLHIVAADADSLTYSVGAEVLK